MTCQFVSAALLLLFEPENNAEMRKKLNEATEKLGRGGASQRAAKAILDHLG